MFAPASGPPQQEASHQHRFSPGLEASRGIARPPTASGLRPASGLPLQQQATPISGLHSSIRPSQHLVFPQRKTVEVQHQMFCQHQAAISIFGTPPQHQASSGIRCFLWRPGASPQHKASSEQALVSADVPHSIRASPQHPGPLPQQRSPAPAHRSPPQPQEASPASASPSVGTSSRRTSPASGLKSPSIRP